MFWGLLLTFLTGAIFLIGIIFLKKFKNKENLSLFTTSLAFVTMLGLLFFDLGPEVISTKNILLIIPVLVGFSFFIVIDKLIPHHHHEHHEKNDDKKDHALHLEHISIITILALICHNFLEGLTLYSVTLNNLTSGLLMMLSISLHNIPLGFQIGNSMQMNKNNYLLISLLVFSSLFGALVVILFGNFNNILESILLSLTLGMLLYILIFELFTEIKGSLKKKSTIYGIIVGVIILIITLLM